MGKMDDDDSYICAFNIGTNNPPMPYFPQSGGHFELVSQQRSEGPITIQSADYSLTTALLAMSTITNTTTSTESLITIIPSSPVNPNGSGTATAYTDPYNASPTGSMSGIDAEKAAGTKPGEGSSSVAKSRIGVAAATAALVIGGLGLFWWWRRRRKQNDSGKKNAPLSELETGKA